MKKKILFGVFALLASLFTVGLAPSDTFADTPICASSTNPLGITRWCDNLTEEQIQKIKTEGRKGIKAVFNRLALNVGQMIADVGAYIAVILVMYGGFLYMTSSGDPGKSSRGQKTIVNATIGIAITKISKLIMKTVSNVVGNMGNHSGLEIAKTITNEFLFWGGAICVLMIIWGGYLYTTSTGDPGKMTRAKNTIIYSLVGLVIMLMAAVIVNFAIKITG